MTPGATVRILPPFDQAFPGTYTVSGTEDIEGGTIVHMEGVESAFDPRFLEVVND